MKTSHTSYTKIHPLALNYFKYQEYFPHSGQTKRKAVSYRHKALVLVQPLLVGGDEEPSILDPACVETRLLFQVFADHVPGVGQELYLDIAGA